MKNALGIFAGASTRRCEGDGSRFELRGSILHRRSHSAIWAEWRGKTATLQKLRKGGRGRLDFCLISARVFLPEQRPFAFNCLVLASRVSLTWGRLASWVHPPPCLRRSQNSKHCHEVMISTSKKEGRRTESDLHRKFTTSASNLTASRPETGQIRGLCYACSLLVGSGSCTTVLKRTAAAL